MVGVAGPSPDWTMSRANKLIQYTLTAFQMLCIAGAYVLDDLSHRKVGVNHHVVYRKRQYLQTLLDADHLMVYGIILGILLAVMVVYLIRHRGRHYLNAIMPLFLLTLAIGFLLVLPAAIAMPAYVYILFLSLIVWGLEAIKAFIKLRLIRVK